jgi:hypothetical protein
MVVPVVGAETEPGGLFFGERPDPAKSRHYYVAAEPVVWDYAPGGRNDVCGDPIPPALAEARVASKVRYIQYTDASFTRRVPETPSLGILGPVLRGVTGEFLVVHFLNRAGQPLSMHPHGVKYDKDSEGARCQLGSGRGAAVEPGERFAYVWQLDASSGPLPGEPSSKGWLYHSHVSGDDEINLGLVGVILVTDAARARPEGTPVDVDRELATLFLLFDESGPGGGKNEASAGGEKENVVSAQGWVNEQERREAGVRAAINGRVFGNLPGLEMNQGERVRWYVFALGSEQDFHTAHWHGQRVIEEGRRRTDVIELMPASMKVADFVADNPGDWLFHCHVADHMHEGMFARMTVYENGTVGVDRSPARAFLGLNQGRDIFSITRAERVPGGGWRLAGEAAVPEVFAIGEAEIQLGLSGKTVGLRLNASGAAQADGTRFRVINSAAGMIVGGLLQFEAESTDASWPLSGDASVPVTLVINGGRHHAEARFADGQ